MEPATGTLPPAPDIPGRVTPEMLLGAEPGSTASSGQPSAALVGAAMAAAEGASNPVPEMPQATDIEVTLPAGLLVDDRLVTTARVRELTGYDEEKLSRINAVENYAKYVTKMLELGVEELDNRAPNPDVLRELLVGDRDALVLGIRRATYGPTYSFQLTCPQCEHLSDVVIDLVGDIPVVELDDPRKRIYEIPETRQTIKIQLLDGYAQEAFSQEIEKKTAPELSTITLAHCVLEIDGKPIHRSEDAVRGLSSHDRDKVIGFLREHQPGPKIDAIPVNCATCEEEYPFRLGLGDLFRF